VVGGCDDWDYKGWLEGKDKERLELDFVMHCSYIAGLPRLVGNRRGWWGGGDLYFGCADSVVLQLMIRNRGQQAFIGLLPPRSSSKSTY